MRLNDRRIEKASVSVKAGDILTLAVGGKVLVLRILDLGKRRGPAREARALYEIVEDA